MKRLLVPAILLSATAAHAGTLTLPYVWTSSMPNVAELNSSFSAVDAAVDDNDARLDAILGSDTCTSSPCDLAAGTTVGGAPIGGGGGAPTTADYLVGTAQAGLSAEIVFGAAVASQCVTGVSGGAVTRSQPDFSWLTGTATDGQVSGGNEEDEIDLLDLRDSAAAGGCTGSQQVRRNAGDTAWECFTASAGGMTSFDADGDNNAPQTVGNAQELQILGGTNGVDTAASATRTITLNLDLSEAAAGGELGGTMDAPTIDDNLSVNGWTIAGSPTITLTQGASVTPVVEGIIEWDSDDDHIMVGASGTAVRFIPAGDFSGDATVSAAGTVTIANDSHDHTTATISGLDGGDIATGTVVAARLDGAMATDAEVAAGYQPLATDLTRLAANCDLENDATPIPDSCVGDGTDGGGGGGGISYADAAAAALAGF